MCIDVDDGVGFRIYTPISGAFAVRGNEGVLSVISIVFCMPCWLLEFGTWLCMRTYGVRVLYDTHVHDSF
jgi:hypothetical protein